MQMGDIRVIKAHLILTLYGPKSCDLLNFSIQEHETCSILSKDIQIHLKNVKFKLRCKLQINIIMFNLNMRFFFVEDMIQK